ncbi:hypothetical protein WSS_A02185 [Rhodococcus opacus M213]|uniref:Uncharacterized protein n=1 Tax=Rhodococcus opacus M213 TaxID=1129896 RepID=K8Y1B6_RHOOP|nr:hypothetical protein [Rhodococcus opacus]EKT84442.1 hypothetical protein WSS_A02185 [Rhodococcus opacus M213]
MNVFWMVEVLMVTLSVIAVSLAAAVTADAVSGRSRERGPDRVDAAVSPSASPVLNAWEVRRDRDWHRVATRAWTICILASVVAVAAVGVLIVVG